MDSIQINCEANIEETKNGYLLTEEIRLEFPYPRCDDPEYMREFYANKLFDFAHEKLVGTNIKLVQDFNNYMKVAATTQINARLKNTK